uniref:Uncharacterized protein n=1 Tax=Timema tahoe TaxID=61484 RepID=A0A7R9IGE1_9NEOP|nr:unnamed protein product [Timema tahoe]
MKPRLGDWGFFKRQPLPLCPSSGSSVTCGLCSFHWASKGDLLALDREEVENYSGKITVRIPDQDLNPDVPVAVQYYGCLHRSDLVSGRIESDDEYDSELDDFIDDGPEETEDYSKHIREIFGYDKSKYNDMDEDDECMESNFGQVLKEEFNSAKIGIMEDLEDIKMEQMEKRKKMMKKKKL